MSEKVIVIGGSGHARSVIDCIRSGGAQAVGILDDALEKGTQVIGVPVLGPVSDYPQYKHYSFIIAVGNNAVRRHISQMMDVRWYTAVHARAAVSDYASLGAGTVVMANAAVNAGAVVGQHCIINTGAVVEHDDRLADYVHISPNAALGGTVEVGEATHVGIGACVRNNIVICGGCVIGAGAAVVRDIGIPGTYVGVPARRLE